MTEAGRSPNPFVFVVGCPRSGTTLLQRLLDAHPQLAVINETLWITRSAKRRNGVTRKGVVTPKLVSELLEDSRFRRLDLPRRDVEKLLDSGRRVPYPQFVSGVFDLYGQAHGKPLVGDKSPGYVREIPALHKLWGNAKFAHLIRDGRDVWLSVSGWKKADRSLGQFTTWRDDPLVTTALWWERSVRMGREARSLLGSGRYHEVRYEDLVEDPEHACRALCTFLGIEYEESMLRFHEGRTKKLEPGLPSKRAWLPPTAGLRDWGTELPERDVERFEAAAGNLLDEIGYPRAATVSARAVAHASAIREAFTRDANERGRALPRHWA